MRVAAIERQIQRFKDQLLQRQTLHPFWEMAFHFQKNWDVKSTNPNRMFQDSLQSTQSRSFWKKDRYRPREIMIEFFLYDPEFTLQAFRELFDEDLDIEVRVDRFIFYCDQLLQLYKKSHPTSIENNHYQDYSIISLYLSLRFPNLYAPYQFNWFVATCSTTDARPIPEVDDLKRYFKLCGIIKKFLAGDRYLDKFYRDEIEKGGLSFSHPMQTGFPAAEFCAFCAESPLKFH